VDAPRFYLISDRDRMGPNPAHVLLGLARQGLPAFQWREKDLSPLATYDHLCQLSVLLGAVGATTRILVNDRVDTAAALRIGVHLPEEGLPTRLARAQLGPGLPIGRSTHSIDAALRARDEGADFVTFGPVFETPSKLRMGLPQGVETLAAVVRACEGFPVLALGGITIERVRPCLDAGAHGVAVIGAIWGAQDPATAYREFADALGIPAER